VKTVPSGSLSAGRERLLATVHFEKIGSTFTSPDGPD